MDVFFFPFSNQFVEISRSAAGCLFQPQSHKLRMEIHLTRPGRRTPLKFAILKARLYPKHLHGV